jgi:DNA gyrase subunit B
MNESLEIHEVIEGLAAVIDCKVSRPNFEGQTKSRFTSADDGPEIERMVTEQTRVFLERQTQAAQVIFDRIREARHARLAARRIAERIYFQNVRQGINEEVYKAQFGARSKNWHDSAVWITDQKLLESHADMLKLDGEAVVLDVCCGSGVVGASFKGKVKKVVGLDLTPEMVSLAKQRLDEVHQGNVYNIPFPDNSFDLVCTREVLHLLPYPEKPVSEIYRVLKPGGQFIVGQILPFGEDDAAWMYRIFKKKQPLIYNMFQEEDFRRLLLSPGFVDLEMTEMNVWESIDVWIDSVETTAVHRHEIRELFRTAPQEAKAIHPLKISSSGEIQDLWRWCVFSVRKPK